jgi:tetratricopeptide (TPR) repeat protein
MANLVGIDEKFMRQLLVMLIVISVVAGARSEEPLRPELAFVRALELFDTAVSKEDYRAAAKELESLVAAGHNSGAVYYNLGNAYFRAGEFGRAIINYRKAIPYLPRDPHLRANLDQAISAAPGKLPPVPAAWWTHVLFWSNWLPYPSKARLFFILVSSTAVVFVLAIYFRRMRLHWLTVAILTVACLLGVDLWLNASSVIAGDRAVIVAETVPRKGMGNSYEPAFDQPLRDGAEFRVLSTTDNWTLGHFDGIGDGWVRNEFVAR